MVGDTAIGFLQGRQYSPQINLVRWGTMAGQAGSPDFTGRSWQLGHDVVEQGVASCPATATLTGPPGSGISALQVSPDCDGYGDAPCTFPWSTVTAVQVMFTEVLNDDHAAHHARP